MDRLHRLKQLTTATLTALTVALVAGCGLVDESFDADLEVTWSIDGSTAPALCNAYGIDTWVIEVRGPEDLDVELDCRVHYWDSGSDLYNLREGTYTIGVVALDRFGVVLTAAESQITIFDDGVVDVLDFAFRSSDFR